MLLWAEREAQEQLVLDSTTCPPRVCLPACLQLAVCCLLPLAFCLLGDTAEFYIAPIMAHVSQAIPKMRPRFAGGGCLFVQGVLPTACFRSSSWWPAPNKQSVNLAEQGEEEGEEEGAVGVGWLWEQRHSNLAARHSTAQHLALSTAFDIQLALSFSPPAAAVCCRCSW